MKKNSTNNNGVASDAKQQIRVLTNEEEFKKYRRIDSKYSDCNMVPDAQHREFYKLGMVSLLLGQDYIECPFCKRPCNHINSVATVLDPTGDENSVIAGTSRVIERGTGERRSALEIEFFCESCGLWYLIFQNHKGCLEVEFAKGLDRFEEVYCHDI